MTTVNKSTRQAAAFVFALAVALIAANAYAGSGTADTTFEPIWDTLTTWSEGTLGRVLAGSMALVGVVAGIARQSLMAFGTGIGAGMGMANLPTIIDGIMGATVEVTTDALVNLPLT